MFGSFALPKVTKLMNNRSWSNSNRQRSIREMVAVSGELAELRQRLRDLELTGVSQTDQDPNAMARTAAEIERLKIRLSTLEVQKVELEKRLQGLIVRSPVGGQVTTPNLEQRLSSRPLNRGDVILTVAGLDGEWHIELLVPDQKISYLKEMLSDEDVQPEIRFRLASNHQHIFFGTLDRLDFRAEKHQTKEQNFVRAFVEVDEQNLGDLLRIGTRVNGRIVCGDRNLFFLLTHEFRDKLAEWFFF